MKIKYLFIFSSLSIYYICNQKQFNSINLFFFEMINILVKKKTTWTALENEKKKIPWKLLIED